NSWPFTDSTYVDPWYYAGYFHFLPQYLREHPQLYYGSRLPWLLPGYVAYQLLPGLTANLVLHVGYHVFATSMLYLLLAETVCRRVALLSALLMASYSPFLQAVGWDYADGPSVGLVLLLLWCLTRAVRGDRSAQAGAFSAGCVAAALAYSNLFWLLLMPALA